MRATIEPDVLATPDGREMADILQSCVHCGMCNATCPTYQVRGDELDGPRGRIYLIKSMLEGESTGRATQVHLDRCLTCRSCETTCPSGVHYGRLVELARPHLDTRIGRRLWDRVQRWLIKTVVPYPRRFRFAVRLGQLFKPVLPNRLAEMVPRIERTTNERPGNFERTMLILDGCAQAAVAPTINAAAKRIFAALGVTVASRPDAGCCGAVAYHLGDMADARRAAKRNIDAWWPAIEQGAEAVLATSSGCAVMLKDYPNLLDDDPDYMDKAAKVAEMISDPSEHVDPARLRDLFDNGKRQSIAFHAPCTMQHGTRTHGSVEACLAAAGFTLTPVMDAHLCCGSAGSYSLLEPVLSNELLDRKLKNLERRGADTIVSANIGCLMHLRRRARVPVQHWLELLAEHLTAPGRR